MKILITSTSSDAKELLEKMGMLAEPSHYPNYYFYEIESLEDLFSLTDLLDEELILRIKKDNERGRDKIPNDIYVVEIYNNWK